MAIHAVYVVKLNCGIEVYLATNIAMAEIYIAINFRRYHVIIL